MTVDVSVASAGAAGAAANAPPLHPLAVTNGSDITHSMVMPILIVMPEAVCVGVALPLNAPATYILSSVLTKGIGLNADGCIDLLLIKSS